MKELDLLKDWQKNKDSFEQVSEIEITGWFTKIIIYCEMDFNHQYLEVLLWTSLNMILMQTIILKTSITMDSFHFKAI
jgi:hypothetical protein